MTDLRSPRVWSLITRSSPSGEIPWSLLQHVANPVSTIFGSPPVMGIRLIWPSLLKISSLPSGIQLGASISVGVTYTTRRSVEEIACVSRVLKRTGRFLNLGGGAAHSTLENTALSVASLL